MFTFTGREYDSESEMYFYRARYYDPNIGRFIQSDQHPGQLSNPLSFINKYAYALNNPINLTDPLGLFSLKSIFKGIAKAAKKVMSNKIAGMIISTAVAGPFGAVAYVNLSGQFSAKDVALVNMAAVAAAAAATGGAAGAAAGAVVGGGFAGFAAGAAAGAVVGGITGGVVGGALSMAGGGSFRDGFMSGAVQGMIAGGLAGGIAGFNASSGMITDEVSSTQAQAVNGYSTTQLERSIVSCALSMGIGATAGFGGFAWMGYTAFIAGAATPIGWTLYAVVGVGSLVGAAGGYSLGAALGCN